jgi:hypothetical protein
MRNQINTIKGNFASAPNTNGELTAHFFFLSLRATSTLVFVLEGLRL